MEAKAEIKTNPEILSRMLARAVGAISPINPHKPGGSGADLKKSRRLINGLDSSLRGGVENHLEPHRAFIKRCLAC
jgi:hypothetical protein